jgi:hypothetical protein
VWGGVKGLVLLGDKMWHAVSNSYLNYGRQENSKLEKMNLPLNREINMDCLNPVNYPQLDFFKFFYQEPLMQVFGRHYNVKNNFIRRVVITYATECLDCDNPLVV